MNTRSLLPALAAALLPALSAAAQATRPTSANADVPVAKVVLFSSGVGYFEHAGTVHGNSFTELRFKTSQINDILKSVVLQDQDGGKIGAITYPSQDPLAKTLKSFQIDITQNPSMAQLLNQLRGARVTIQAQAEHLSGTILGVETRQRPSDKGDAAVPTLNLLAGATIRSIDLQAISNLSLDDPQLQDELTKALAALVQARDQDKKPVTINFSGTGDRRVRLGYVVETPVWKTSYRLLLDEKPAPNRLQGWAIVENQTESDWNNVSLSLVSGRPISFMMDLYQPLYATRPTVVPDLFAGLRPQVYADGIADKKPVDELRRGDQSRSFGTPAASPGITLRSPTSMQLNEVVTTGAAADIDAAASIAAMAEAAKLGELFQYTVNNVTLARQKSAMLPIITDSVEVERVSIYNTDVLQSNPLNGVLLTNTTGKHLLQGPVTVLDKGSYAGDARIDNVGPGQHRFLSYGIDLDMAVNTKRSATNAVTTATIRKGLLILNRRLTASVEYLADNKSGKDKALVVEHRVQPGWKLIDSPTLMEQTPDYYRFKGVASANKVSRLVVRDELPQIETIALVNANLDMLLSYKSNLEIPKTVRDALAKAAQLRQAVADADRDANVRSQQINDIGAEQTRIRENMKTVAQSTQYYERLLSKLNEQESSIETLQRERAAIIVRRDAARKDLDDYLANLTIE